jgi:hypothetical protein
MHDYMDRKENGSGKVWVFHQLLKSWDDPAQLAKGIDPQLLRAIEEVKKQVKENPRILRPEATV